MAAKPAWAANGNCPAAFDSYDCAVDSVNVCRATSSGDEHYYECSAKDTDEGATITLVKEYGNLSYLSAWGWVSGERFCCAEPPPAGYQFSVVKLHGSDHADTLKYTHAGTWNLDRMGPSMWAYIDGENGNDTIVGSNSPSPNYDENLAGGDICTSGGTGNDTVQGGNGDDTLSGACGDDTLLGGGGNDDIEGDEGDDVLLGGPGNDTLDGGDGNDGVSGGDGDDIIDRSSNGGYDALCGDAGGDELTAAGTDGDQLWGADAADTEICAGDPTVGFSGAGWTSGCTFSTVITTRPAECP